MLYSQLNWLNANIWIAKQALTEPFLPPGYPKDGSYADLLLWHLYVWGTGAGANATTRAKVAWEEAVFINLVFKGMPTDRPKKTYDAWIGEGRRSAPGDQYAPRIAKALFKGEIQFTPWENELEEARKRCLGPNQNIARLNVADAISAVAAFFPEQDPALIPDTVRYFQGRDNEVNAAINALLASDGGTAILVHGGPGIGKTELTKAVAHDSNIAKRFGKWRYFVALATAKTSKDMQEAIVRAVGCEPKSPFQTALNKLRAVDALLVLDNLETPWEADRQATEATLDELVSFAKVDVVASFRGSDIEGPDWERVPLDIFPPETARELFADISGDWTKQDPFLDEFIKALGGIPLALSLVARRAYSDTSLAPLWQEWERTGTEFVTREGVPAGTLTSLPFSIELSLNSPRIGDVEDAGRLFSFLGCLPAGLSFDDCSSLLGRTAYRARASLLNTGLAVPELDRVNLLPPIREHARRYQPPTGDDNKRWVKLFLEKIESFEVSAERMSGISKADALYADIYNIHEALIAAFRQKLEIDLVNYTRQCVLLSNQLEVDYTMILDEIGDNKDIFESEQFHKIGLMKSTVLLNKGDHIAALNLAEEIYNACHAEGNEQGMADSLFMGGTILLILEEYEPALEFLEKSLRHFQNIDDEEGERNVEPSLISVLTQLGRLDDAEKVIDKSKIYSNRNEGFLEISRNMQFYAACGDFELAKEDSKHAIEYYLKCSDYARNLGAIKVELRMLLLLIECHLMDAEQVQACMVAERALKLCQSLGDVELENQLRSFFTEMDEKNSEQGTQ